MQLPNESFIDRKYRSHLFRSLKVNQQPVRWTPMTYRLRCPLCDARGSTLVWMAEKSTWKFFCNPYNHRNCQKQLEFPQLLKQWNSELYVSYLQERNDAGLFGAGTNCPLPDPSAHRRAPLKSPGADRLQRIMQSNFAAPDPAELDSELGDQKSDRHA